jgi:hypothetical protein
MKRTVALVAIAVLGFATAGRLLAQNPATGTWKLNVAKSKTILDQLPKA